MLLALPAYNTSNTVNSVQSAQRVAIVFFVGLFFLHGGKGVLYIESYRVRSTFGKALSSTTGKIFSENTLLVRSSSPAAGENRALIEIRRSYPCVPVCELNTLLSGASPLFIV